MEENEDLEEMFLEPLVISKQFYERKMEWTIQRKTKSFFLPPST
jgi:hypothetical protein